jgi:predicted nucleic acid-binding protein
VFVLDASVWVSFLFPDDAFHRRTIDWFEHTADLRQQLASPLLVLPEVSGAIARRTRYAEDGLAGAAEVARFPSLSLVPLDEDLAQAAADVAARHYLRGSDAVYAALALHLGVPLVTWDEEQRERARRVVTAVTP